VLVIEDEPDIARLVALPRKTRLRGRTSHADAAALRAAGRNGMGCLSWIFVFRRSMGLKSAAAYARVLRNPDPDATREQANSIECWDSRRGRRLCDKPFASSSSRRG